MCTDKFGYLDFVRQSIKEDEREITNFGRANDNLSRAVTALRKCNNDWAESFVIEREFDGGEFSRAACARDMQKEMFNIILSFGFPSFSDFHEELRSRVSEKYIHFNLNFVLPEDEL